jgi:hypothetical protein
VGVFNVLKYTVYGIVFFFISLSFVYAEATELRNVMPNSWQKVMRLPPAEEAAFLQANKAIEDTIKTEFKFNTHFRYPPRTLEHTLVYQQMAGSDEFYRMVLTYEQEPDFISGRTSFVGAQECLSPFALPFKPRYPWAHFSETKNQEVA